MVGGFCFKKKERERFPCPVNEICFLKIVHPAAKAVNDFFGKVCSTHLDSEKQNDCVSTKLIRPCVCFS